MYNKKVLSKATKNLNSAKAPAKKKDIIVDPMGQWKYPGQNTRIPGNNITMQGVPYPVLGIDNTGFAQMMYPGANYTFPGDYVDEYPQMKKGGDFSTDINKRRKLLRDWTYGQSIGMLQEKQIGGTNITKLSKDDETKFQKYFQTLPDNLMQDDATYDIRGYWNSEGRPETFNYNQPKDKDGFYHAYSINGNTGEYLKSPVHETFQHAVEEDRKIGYRPITNVYGRNITVENESIADPGEESFLRNTTGPTSYSDGGDFIEAELDDDQIETLRKGGYIVEDISVPSLTKAQLGQENSVVKSVTPWEGAAKVTGDENTPPVIYEGKDVTVKAQAPDWARFQKEYEKSNPYERYLSGEKNKYLRKQKGLNRLAGVTADNFPKSAEERIRQEYDRKKNTYITRRLGKTYGFDPRKREQYVDYLSPKEREIVAGSKFGSKLQPSVWSRTLSGLRSVYNVLPFSDITARIPGMTEEENKAALTNPLEGLEVLAPLDVPGVVIANKVKNMNAENPSWYSGEMMGNVSYGDVAGVNPLTLLDIYGLPKAAISLGRGVAKGSKAAKNIYNTVATGESAIPVAWKSPAAGITQSASDDMFKSLVNSGKLTDKERAIVAEYQYNSRPFTGRDNLKIDQSKRDALNNIIQKYNLSSPEKTIATRRFNIEGNTLGADITGNRINFGERPTSFTAGVTEGYSGAPDRLVIPNRYLKTMGNKFIANEYSPLSQESLGMLNDAQLKEFASKIGNENKLIQAERELIGTGLDFNKIGKVKNDLGGYDIIVKPNTNVTGDYVKAGLGAMDMSNYEIKNPDYFTQLLDTYTSKQLSPSSKKVFKGIIESVKKQNGIATERQYNELQRLKSGNFDYGKKDYPQLGQHPGGTFQIGGETDYEELELTPEEIDWYLVNGYDVELMEED